MNRATSATGWVRNPDGTLGWTWNPFSGCRNHVNGLCKGGGFPCYAYRLAHGRLKQRYLANGNLAMHPIGLNGALGYRYDANDFKDPFYPRFWEERLTPLHIPRKANSPKKGIFVCDMGELFGDWIPRSWQEQIFNAIKANPDYRFYLLTKQPQNLIKFSPFPENCWVGVTATDYDYFVDACGILGALKHKGDIKVAFISLEPLLSWEDSVAIFRFTQPWLQHGEIDWLIIGAQTKPYKPPEIEWVREIVEAADKAGIPVFLKDNLKPLLPREYPFSTDHYDIHGHFVEGLRQEVPI